MCELHNIYNLSTFFTKFGDEDVNVGFSTDENPTAPGFSALRKLCFFDDDGGINFVVCWHLIIEMRSCRSRANSS
jgi:hypothetical protein